MWWLQLTVIASVYGLYLVGQITQNLITWSPGFPGSPGGPGGPGKPCKTVDTQCFNYSVTIPIHTGDKNSARYVYHS